MTKEQNGMMDTIVDLIPDDKFGKEIIIDTMTISEEDVRRQMMRTMYNPESYDLYYDFKAGKYKRLVVNGETMMSTTPMERRTNREIIMKANGHVLIAGLGLGMILLPIQAKKEVKSITVVEINKRIINMVAPYLPNTKINFVHADICEYTPDQKFDTIYFDIWQTISSDNWGMMKAFGRKFRKYLNKDNPDAWLGHWLKDRVQNMAAQERKGDRERAMWSEILGGNVNKLCNNLDGIKL